MIPMIELLKHDYSKWLELKQLGVTARKHSRLYVGRGCSP